MKSKKQNTGPPKIPENIIRHMYPDENYYTTISDIEEDYNRLLIEKNDSYAQLWYWFQLLSALPHYVTQKLKWGVVMFKNYD